MFYLKIIKNKRMHISITYIKEQFYNSKNKQYDINTKYGGN